MTLSIFAFLAWLVLGIFNISYSIRNEEDIPLYQYVFAWLLLVINLFINCFE